MLSTLISDPYLFFSPFIFLNSDLVCSPTSTLIASAVKQWQPMQHCAAEAAVPPASFRDQPLVSEDLFFFRWSCADCVHAVYVWVVSIPNPTVDSSLPVPLPSVLSYKTAKHFMYCILFVLSYRPQTRNVIILLRTSESRSAAFHRTPSLAHMFICTPPVPPFVMSCFIPASITQRSLSLGIAYRLITFLEFNVMTGGQANFWGDKWWAKWLQSTGRQMVMELLSEVAPAFPVNGVLWLC